MQDYTKLALIIAEHESVIDEELSRVSRKFTITGKVIK